jgi:hypothetical protein
VALLAVQDFIRSLACPSGWYGSVLICAAERLARGEPRALYRLRRERLVNQPLLYAFISSRPDTRLPLAQAASEGRSRSFSALAAIRPVHSRRVVRRPATIR